jgi:hypothetical protein
MPGMRPYCTGEAGNGGPWIRKSGDPMLFPGGRDCVLVRKCGTSLVQLTTAGTA